MKRGIKWLINRFREWVNKSEKYEIICIILGVVIGILCFVSIDKVPATTFDYEPLEKQVIAIQQNPDLLFKTDGNIHIDNEIITATFSNDECELIVQFDQNFEVLSTSKIDSYTFWLFALALALLIGVCAYVLSVVICLILMLLFAILLTILMKFIDRKNKLNKSN